MPRYRKKPVEVDAVVVSEAMRSASEDWDALPAWLRAAYDRGEVMFLAENVLRIETLEGAMIARPDDWIICGVAGELYPCKPDIFAQTYEEV